MNRVALEGGSAAQVKLREMRIARTGVGRCETGMLDEMKLLTLVRWAGLPLLLGFITEVAQLLLKVRAFPCGNHSLLSLSSSYEAP